MTPFIDLIGASGAVYRFRRAEGQLPPVGGNFVYIEERDGSPCVLGCGKVRALGRSLMPSLPNTGTSTALFIRLNVSSEMRDSEHEDLVAGLPQPFSIYDTE